MWWTICRWLKAGLSWLGHCSITRSSQRASLTKAMWLKKHIVSWTALASLLSSSSLDAATLTGRIVTPRGQPLRTNIAFIPASTPYGAQDRVVVTQPLLTNTDANGEFTVQLAGGTYFLQVGRPPSDRLWFTLPDDNNTYSLATLVTNRLVWTNGWISSTEWSRWFLQSSNAAIARDRLEIGAGGGGGGDVTRADLTNAVTAWGLTNDGALLVTHTKQHGTPNLTNWSQVATGAVATATTAGWLTNEVRQRQWGTENLTNWSQVATGAVATATTAAWLTNEVRQRQWGTENLTNWSLIPTGAMATAATATWLTNAVEGKQDWSPVLDDLANETRLPAGTVVGGSLLAGSLYIDGQVHVVGSPVSLSTEDLCFDHSSASPNRVWTCVDGTTGRGEWRDLPGGGGGLLTVRTNSVNVGTAATLDMIAGNNVVLTATSLPSNVIAVQINSAGGAGGGTAYNFDSTQFAVAQTNVAIKSAPFLTNIQIWASHQEAIPLVLKAAIGQDAPILRLDNYAGEAIALFNYDGALTAPAATLGAVKITGGNPQPGHVLTAQNDLGEASWAPPPGGGGGFVWPEESETEVVYTTFPGRTPTASVVASDFDFVAVIGTGGAINQRGSVYGVFGAWSLEAAAAGVRILQSVGAHPFHNVRAALTNRWRWRLATGLAETNVVSAYVGMVNTSGEPPNRGFIARIGTANPTVMVQIIGLATNSIDSGLAWSTNDWIDTTFRTFYQTTPFVRNMSVTVRVGGNTFHWSTNENFNPSLFWDQSWQCAAHVTGTNSAMTTTLLLDKCYLAHRRLE